MPYKVTLYVQIINTLISKSIINICFLEIFNFIVKLESSYWRGYIRLKYPVSHLNLL